MMPAGQGVLTLRAVEVKAVLHLPGDGGEPADVDHPGGFGEGSQYDPHPTGTRLHHAISKLARKTNHIDRFNNTLRQRASRLVHDALSFSKKLANHIGAAKLCICHYNLTRAAA